MKVRSRSCPKTCSRNHRSSPIASNRRTEQLRQFITDEVEMAINRKSADDAALWNRCFGTDAPALPKARQERINQHASARYFLSLINKSDADDHER